MGFKTGWFMLPGAVLTYGFLAPEMVSRGVIPSDVQGHGFAILGPVATFLMAYLF